MDTEKKPTYWSSFGKMATLMSIPGAIALQREMSSPPPADGTNLGVAVMSIIGLAVVAAILALPAWAYYLHYWKRRDEPSIDDPNHPHRQPLPPKRDR